MSGFSLYFTEEKSLWLRERETLEQRKRKENTPLREKRRKDLERYKLRKKKLRGE